MDCNLSSLPLKIEPKLEISSASMPCRNLAIDASPLPSLAAFAMLPTPNNMPMILTTRARTLNCVIHGEGCVGKFTSDRYRTFEHGKSSRSRDFLAYDGDELYVELVSKKRMG